MIVGTLRFGVRKTRLDGSAERGLGILLGVTLLNWLLVVTLQISAIAAEAMERKRPLA